MEKYMKKVIIFVITFLVVGLIIFTSIFILRSTQKEEQIVEDEHSKLYIPGVSVEDVILYFNEVAFGAEIINAGDPYKIQKWREPIYYFLDGDLTEEDAATLLKFNNWLNTIEGFPGIYETKDVTKTNLNIYFCDKEMMLAIMGKEFNGMDGAVNYWYTDDIIDRATICYRTEIDQYVRNSVIIEEIYNGLGLIQDTSLRKDSIIYSEFSMPQELTKIDELLLRLLYSKELKPGMGAKECEEVIRQLYY
jgi:hypothetical protein